MKSPWDLPVRCAITLAAGDGQRLQPFIRRLRGDCLPKQYMNFIGRHSLLEHTFQRVEKLVEPECLFTVVGQDHLNYREVGQQLSSRPKGTVVLQPKNKSTLPGLLLPLKILSKQYPEAVVAVFPADQFILQEERFMEQVSSAFRAVEMNPSLLILLGIDPERPEPEYGYILPGNPVPDIGSGDLRTVSGFVEKPGPNAVSGLIQAGGLWNTFVMVFQAKAMLDLLRRAAPFLYSSFERIGEAVGTRDEMKTIETVYRDIQPMDFSREILERFANQFGSPLAVLRVQDVFWSDWGSEFRILSDLKRMGYLNRFREIYQSASYA